MKQPDTFEKMAHKRPAMSEPMTREEKVEQAIRDVRHWLNDTYTDSLDRIEVRLVLDELAALRESLALKQTILTAITTDRNLAVTAKREAQAQLATMRQEKEEPAR